MTYTEKISIVVLTHDRIDELARTLQHLQQLACAPPILVVDSAFTTCSYVRRHFPTVRMVRSSVDHGAAARTLGVARVRTPYVAFCGEDAWWAHGALERACALLDAYPRVGAVAPSLLVGRQELLDPACARMAASPLASDDLPGRRVMTFMADAVVMRTEAYRSVGGYEPRLFIGEEEGLMGFDLLVRGWQMVYASEVVAYRYPSVPRNATRQRLLALRNRAWTAWLRLPWRDALGESLRIVRQASSAGLLEAWLIESMRGVVWILRQRRVVPREVRDLWQQAMS